MGGQTETRDPHYPYLARQEARLEAMEGTFMRIADKLEEKVDELGDAIAEIKEAAAETRANQEHLREVAQEIKKTQEEQARDITQLKTRTATLAALWGVLATSVGAILYIVFEKLVALAAFFKGGAS